MRYGLSRYCGLDIYSRLENVISLDRTAEMLIYNLATSTFCEMS